MPNPVDNDQCHNVINKLKIFQKFNEKQVRYTYAQKPKLNIPKSNEDETDLTAI